MVSSRGIGVRYTRIHTFWIFKSTRRPVWLLWSARYCQYSQNILRSSMGVLRRIPQVSSPLDFKSMNVGDYVWQTYVWTHTQEQYCHVRLKLKVSSYSHQRACRLRPSPHFAEGAHGCKVYDHGSTGRVSSLNWEYLKNTIRWAVTSEASLLLPVHPTVNVPDISPFIAPSSKS